MKQEIYKRMEIVIVFIPLTISFILGNKWFNPSDSVAFWFDLQLHLAIVLSVEVVRCTFHYIFVYIFS